MFLEVRKLYLIKDLETPIIRYMKRAASPFHPDNKALIDISKRKGEETKVTFLPAFKDPDAENIWDLGITDDITTLVGFNLKFDLLHMWHLPELQAFLKRGGTIWDCQYVEYLLEGQQLHAQMCSMDSIIEKYGGKLKVDAVKAHWDQGIETRDIHPDILEEYSIGDGDNTEIIFLGQLKRAAQMHPNFINMIKARMDGLLATTEMEFNGLKIDEELGHKRQAELAERLAGMDQELSAFIPELPPELVFNWQSRYHKSYLIFGGTAKYQKWVQHRDPDTLELLYANKTEKWPLFDGVPIDPNGDAITFEEHPTDGSFYRRVSDNARQDTFAGGKRKGEGKTKNVTIPDPTKPKGAKKDHFFRFPGYTKPLKKWVAGGEDGKGEALYSTSSEVIDELGKRDIPFLKLMAERQKLTKDLGTYYWAEDEKGNRKGMLTLVSEFDGLIHHKLNHTSTITTRLSSSDPNVQNIPRGDKSDVKELFISRFPDGEMGEIDYSQLEVIVQGWLTGDKNLRQDIIDGVDFHCKRLAQKLGEDYDEIKKKAKDDTHPDYPSYSVQRTGVKGFSFQRAYGAGAAAISEATGMSIDDIEQLIEDEKIMYPKIEAFNSSVSDAVHSSRLPTDDTIYTKSGPAQLGRGEWFSPTGTRYTFRESEAPEFMQKKGTKVSFSPPDLKNYPIQGTGGEVVQLVLGKLFRHYLRNDRYNGRALLVNTVHDCVWFDYCTEVRDQVMNDAVRIMQAIPQFLQSTFNIDCGVIFRVDAEYGPNMLDLHHYHSPYYI